MKYLLHMKNNFKVAGRCLMLCLLHFLHGVIPCRYTSHEYLDKMRNKQMTDNEKITMLRNALVGFDPIKQVRLEAKLLALPVPDCHWVNMINAIRAIINTYSPVPDKTTAAMTTRQMYEKAIMNMVDQDYSGRFVIRDGIEWDGDRPMQRIDVLDHQNGDVVAARWILSSDDAMAITTFSAISQTLFENVAIRVQKMREERS